jgi:ABC-type uncharacterized transport system involved in gliding motility auxiliary subunit
MLQRILNIVGWIGVALVVVAVGIRLLRPGLDKYAIYTAWGGLALVLIYAAGQWREIVGSLNRRQSRYATIATTSVIIVLGILVAVNYLSNRRFMRWDLTANSVNTLSEQSLKVIAGLKSPINLVVIDLGSQIDRHRDRMSMYDNASNDVTVEYFDPEKDPIRAKAYGITAVPTIVIEYMGRTEKVTTVEEREITSAIVRVIAGQARKLYFVQGHGEPSPTGAEGGFSGVTGLLKGDNVTVETLALTQHKDVPQDATALAIIAPTADLFDQEVDPLKEYLARGGKLLVMMDPDIAPRPQPLPKLTALLQEWGIEVGNDVVIDVSGRTNSASLVVAVPPYPNHPITERVESTIFPLARSVTPAAKAPEGKTVQPLIETSKDAWAETDLAGLKAEKVQQDPTDKAGPVTIAATVSATAAAPPAETKDGEDPPTPPQTRIAVFGNSRFASDSIAGTGGNADLFLNTVSWLTAQENLIAVRPRERSDSRLSITPGQLEAVWYFSIFGVPLLVVICGIFVWAQRRRS